MDTSFALEKENDPSRCSSRWRRCSRRERFLPFPSIDFLVQAPVLSDVTVFDKEVLYRTAEILIKTLADYKIMGKVEDILPDPR